MSRLLVARRKTRRGLFLPMSGLKTNPSLLFPLDSIDPSELEDLVRAILAKGGVTDEPTIQKIVEEAEKDSELRIKVAEARTELRRLMSLKAQGLTLISRGFRKWKEAFFPATKRRTT